MSEKVQIDFTVDGAPAAKTLGELEQKAEQLNEALRGAELGSESYKRLNDQLAQTNREVKNLELGFEALDNEQVASEIGSVAGAVGDVTSAMILLGGESETLQQVAANVQMAMGVSMAFKGAIEGVSSAQKLWTNLAKQNIVVMKLQTIAQKVLNAVTKAFPIFLIITGITALVGAIIWMTQNIDKVKAKLVEWKDNLMWLLPPIWLIIKAYELLFGEIRSEIVETNKARQKAQKAITKDHQQRLKQIKDEMNAEEEAFNGRQDRFDLDIARMEAEGKNSNALKQAKIQDQLDHEKFVLESINKQIDSWRTYYEELFVLSGKSREDFIAQMRGQGIDLEALQQEALDLVEQQNDKIFAAETKLIAFKTDLRKQASKEEIEAAEETVDRLVEIRNDFLLRLEAAENEYLDSQLTAQQREENAVRDKYFTLLEEARQFGEDTQLLEEAQQQALFDIREKYRQQEQDAEDAAKLKAEQRQQEALDVAKKGAQDLANAAEELAKFQSDRAIKRANEKVARGEALTKAEIKQLKRQDKIQKAFALAQIASDTARGISGAIAAGAGLPFPANLGAIASGIAAVLSGAVQAAGVLGESVDIPTVDITESSSTGDASTNNVPDINDAAFGSTLLNQPPQQVVVVDSITDGINAVNVIEAGATFG